MTNPRLATRYAKSLIDLAKEQNQLDATYADMQTLQQLCKRSAEFASMIKSPVIKPSAKTKIVAAVTEGKIGQLSNLFVQLLISKGREPYLAEIAHHFIAQYKDLKGIKTVKLTTATPIDDATKAALINKLYAEGTSIDLETVVDEKLIGGFVMQTGDQLVDASIAYDLKAIQTQFLNNDFIYKIR
jgi:F-type H+-transporting ATPase subunit delta